MTIHEHISLQPFNTFGIGATARYLVEVTSAAEIVELQSQQIFQKSPKLILGGGSNILLTRDYDGLVIKMANQGIALEREDLHHYYVTAQAGVGWHAFVLWCIERGYAGVENLSLIPGLVGASPMQNIGAYGVEIKNVCTAVDAIHIHTGEVVSFSSADCEFAYRESIFKHRYRGEFIITAVHFRLDKTPRYHVEYGDVRATLDEMKVFDYSIKSISDAIIKIRSAKLPDPQVLGNAGSFFKNPTISLEACGELLAQYPLMPHYPQPSGTVKLPAGWLIEQCGWKGKRVGNTGSHDRQALVLVNYGGATGAEIYDLALAIQKSVMEKFGIAIEPEVNLV